MDAEDGITSTQVDVPNGFWQREESHYPKPLTPLGSSLIIDGFNQAWPKIFEEFGMLLDGLELREIGGYVYQRAKPLGGRESGGGKLPPKPVLWLLFRLHPSFRRRAARCKEAIGARRDRMLVDRWYEEWRPSLVSDIDRWRALDLASLPDDELARHLAELHHWASKSVDIHFNLAVAYAFPIALLAFFCRDRLGYSDQQVLPLLSGLSEASSEPALELAKLADLVRADKELTDAVLLADANEVHSLLAERRGDLAERFDEYLHRFGCRALRYELIEECLSERPELVASLLQDELRRSTDLASEQEQLALARADGKAAALAALPNEGQRDELLGLIADAERAYPVREDNEFYTVSVPLALERFAFLESGRRLAAKGILASLDDVFFLRLDEVVAATKGHKAEYSAMVAGRRAEYEAIKESDPPAAYGEEPPTLPLDVLPPQTRLAMEVLAYSVERVFEPERSHSRGETGSRELRGIGASKGTYVGSARVVMGEDQFDKLQPGDVLVCPITSPVWSILFAKVGALVTDAGGVLSHPAIIAREYGIPAVVATGNATQIIKDGTEIVVDGETGVVRLQG
jgi:pyruvate,water dikinase